MNNSFGSLFTISTWGESHGGGIGVVIDGCPPLLNLTQQDIQTELDRRKPGQSNLTTPRKEADEVEILSGLFEGKTTGTPLAMLVRNKNANPKAYDHLKSVYRPSHADFTYDSKYGIRNWEGGGRSSARETIGRVAAGAVAKKILKKAEKIEILAYVSQMHTLHAAIDPEKVTLKKIESNPVRCPDTKVAAAMATKIEQARKDGDSLGGIITCVAKNVPAGLGEPVFNKLKADLAKAMLSIPASMGFQIGSGYNSVTQTGSEHNDPFYMDGQTVRTKTNNSGGIQGGISNGETILFTVAFKPTGTIFKEQDTVTTKKKNTKLSAKGRHDPCVLPRAVPIVESMAALVLVDHYLQQRARSGLFS